MSLRLQVPKVYGEKIIRILQVHLGKYYAAVFLLNTDDCTVNAKSIESVIFIFLL